MIPQGEPSTRSLEMLSIYMFFGSSFGGAVGVESGRAGGGRWSSASAYSKHHPLKNSAQ